MPPLRVCPWCDQETDSLINALACACVCHWANTLFLHDWDGFLPSSMLWGGSMDKDRAPNRIAIIVILHNWYNFLRAAPRNGSQRQRHAWRRKNLKAACSRAGQAFLRCKLPSKQEPAPNLLFAQLEAFRAALPAPLGH